MQIQQYIQNFMGCSDRDLEEISRARPLFYKIALIIQKTFSFCKKLPQYKYISRPIYKFTAKHTNTVLATAVSFFLTDLIVHQFIQETLPSCIFNECTLSYDPYRAAFWMGLSIPVMWVKSRQQHPYNPRS